MTIKNDELDNAVAEAQRAVAAAQEDLKTHRRHLLPHRQHRRWMPTERPPRRMQPPTPAPSRALSAISPRPRQPWTRQTPSDRTHRKGPQLGSIVELNAKVGATVTGGMVMGEGDTSGGKQCMQIADLSKMKVTVQVGEKDIAKIAVGQSANVTYPAFPDIVSQGTVTAIASVANSDAANGGGGSVTFNVDILIEAPDSRLKPGMTAESRW